MALGFKLQMPKGPAMNRAAMGLSLVVGSLCWWLSSAILLVQKGEFYFILNMMTVFAFFVGLAFFVPRAHGASRPNQHSLPGLILVWAGLILGLAHSLALMFSESWPARLIEIYARLGLHGSPPAA